jgi:hypothetical protein
MSRYYANYGQYLGAQRCCDLRGQGPQGIPGPTGASALGQRGFTGPTGAGLTGPTGRSCRGPTGEPGPTGPAGGPTGATGPTATSISMIGGYASSTITSNTVAHYFGVYVAGVSLDLNVTESNVITRIPFNCQMSNIYVDLITAAPGVGKSYTFTVRNNSTDTSLTLTISDLSTSGSNTTNTATFNAGDIFTVICNPSNTPNTTNLRWTCKLTAI